MLVYPRVFQLYIYMVPCFCFFGGGKPIPNSLVTLDSSKQQVGAWIKGLELLTFLQMKRLQVDKVRNLGTVSGPVEFVPVWVVFFSCFFLKLHPGRLTAGTYSHLPNLERKWSEPKLHDYVPCWSSGVYCFCLYLGKIPILTNIFQVGWNHQLAVDAHDRSMGIFDVLVTSWVEGAS